MGALLGGPAGSVLRLENRLEGAGEARQRRLVGEGAGRHRARFVEGSVPASPVFCVGPLTVFGPLSDGLGRGVDRLALSSTLTASLRSRSRRRWGGALSAAALTVLVVHDSLTLAGWALGGLPSTAQIWR